MALAITVPRFPSRFVKLDDTERGGSRFLRLCTRSLRVWSGGGGVRPERDKQWLWLGIAGVLESRDVQYGDGGGKRVGDLACRRKVNTAFERRLDFS